MDLIKFKNLYKQYFFNYTEFDTALDKVLTKKQHGLFYIAVIPPKKQLIEKQYKAWIGTHRTAYIQHDTGRCDGRLVFHDQMTISTLS